MLWHEIAIAQELNEKNFTQVNSQSSWTYQELQNEIAKSAGYLEGYGLQKGEVVALQVPRNPMWLPLFLGALSRGFCVLLLNDSYTASELSYYLIDAQAKIAFIPKVKLKELEQILAKQESNDSKLPRLFDAESIESNRKLAEPLSPRTDLDAESLAVLAYTSGTTGKQKVLRFVIVNIMGTLKRFMKLGSGAEMTDWFTLCHCFTFTDSL